MCSKAQDSEKLQDIFVAKYWIQDNFDQCTKFSVCEKTEEIIKEFCSKHSELKKYFQKRLLTRLLVWRHEAAFAYSMNAYVEEIDPSPNYWYSVTFIKRFFIIRFSDHLNWTVIPVETNNQVQVILVKMKIIWFLLFYCTRIFELYEAHSKWKIWNYFKIEIW